MVRLAIIGCGNHSRRYHGPALARCAAEHADVELVVACDRDIERARGFCRDFGFARPCDDMTAMLDADRLDGCVVVMPIPAIAAVATTLLERGMPCTVEKPLGATPAEVRALAATAARTGTPHLVSVDRRFNPLLREAVAWCRQRGDIRYIAASMLRHQRREPTFMVETAIHIVDALCGIGGRVTQCHCRRPGGGGLAGGWFHLTLDFASGVMADVKVFPTDGWSDERYELYGEGFCAEVASMVSRGASLCCREVDRVVLERHVTREAYDFVTSGAYGETEAFVGGLRDRRPMAPTVMDVLPSLELCWKVTGWESAPAGL